MIENATYRVGIYLRLSKEDENGGESTSITNQREIILKYMKEQHLQLVEEYVDDGVSGTTFERLGWKRLIKDIEQKKINMLITKDLSRFGRNEGQQLLYLDYLAENNIRYVALLDHVDTADENNTSNEMIPIQCFFNEKHVRDTSKKMRASVYHKRCQGNFLGSSAPYGYRKNPDNKYQLMIDEEAACVVQKIYSLFIEGKGISEIARILTSEKIPIPSEHKKLHRGQKSLLYGIWNQRTIADILRLPTYVGDLTQGRLKKPSYKSKKIVRMKKENWIVVPNTCPAIIDRATFEMAQNIFQKNKHQGKNSQDILLKGLLYCKECGHTIGFRLYHTQTKKEGRKTRCYGNCNYWAKHKQYQVCTPHNIQYYRLESVILQELQEIFATALKKEELKEFLLRHSGHRQHGVQLEQKRRELANDLEKYPKMFERLYCDKLEEVISEEMYIEIQKKLKQEQQEKVEALHLIEKQISLWEVKVKNLNHYYEHFIEEIFSLRKPSHNFLANIIEKITIDENHHLEIYYRFVNPFLKK